MCRRLFNKPRICIQWSEDFIPIFLDKTKSQREKREMTTRRATHAGSWYTSNGKSLSKELDGWLQAASAKVSLDCLVAIWSTVGISSSNCRKLYWIYVLNYILYQTGGGNPAARAIIGPHAGYKYCGACGGHAYARIDPSNIKRVFILGPSHHVRLNGCAVSGCVKVIYVSRHNLK